MTNQETTRKSYRHQLYNGGWLFVNRCGTHYAVDVYDIDDEHVYHAFYGSWDEAMTDADSWAKWPTSEDRVAVETLKELAR